MQGSRRREPNGNSRKAVADCASWSGSIDAQCVGGCTFAKQRARTIKRNELECIAQVSDRVLYLKVFGNGNCSECRTLMAAPDNTSLDFPVRMGADFQVALGR
jgi:hypothetical protein